MKHFSRGLQHLPLGNAVFPVRNGAFAMRNEALKARFCCLFAAWRLFSNASRRCQVTDNKGCCSLGTAQTADLSSLYWFQNGFHQFVLDCSASAGEFASLILENDRNREAYLQLRRAARDAYETTFNWQQWAKTVRNVTGDLIMRRAPMRSES